MLGLALSGGGSKGAYQEGALRWIIRHRKIRFDAIAGVSVGALNGAFLAQFSREQQVKASYELQKMWSQISTKDVYKSWPLGMMQVPWKHSVYNSKPLRDLVGSRLCPEKLRASGVPFRAGAVDLHTGEYVSVPSDHPEIVQAVMGSAAFPVMLEPVKFGDIWLTDGGVRNVTPVQELLDMGCTEIIAIVPHAASVDKTSQKDPWKTHTVAIRVLDILMNEITNEDFDECESRGVKLTIIRPSEALQVDSLDFDPVKSHRLAGRGLLDAVRALHGGRTKGSFRP